MSTGTAHRGKVNGLVTASQAFSAVSAVSVPVCLISIVALGTVYTMLGGARAVVWTDVVQAFVFLLAFAVSVLLILHHFEWHAGRIYQIASTVTSGETGYPSTRLVSFEFDLAIEATFWAIVFARLIEIFQSGTNQTFVQRLLATGSRRNMIKAMVGKGVVDLIFLVLVIATGWCLVAFYHQTAAAESIEHPDDVMAHFVVNQIPVVLRGLIMAGLFAALMSTFDSALNSVSSVAINDFYRRYVVREGSQKHYVVVSRIVTIVFGLVLLLFALWQYSHSDATVMERVMKLNNLLVSPLLCFFVLGVFSKRANTWGVLVGGVVGIVVALLLQGFPGLFRAPLFYGVPGWFAAPLEGFQINWMWVGGFATLASIFVGYFASLLFPAPSPAGIQGLSLRK